MKKKEVLNGLVLSPKRNPAFCGRYHQCLFLVLFILHTSKRNMTFMGFLLFVNYKQLLDEVLGMFRIIKVEVSVIG